MPAPICECPWSCIEAADYGQMWVLRCTQCGKFVNGPAVLPVLVAMIREVGMMADEARIAIRKDLEAVAADAACSRCRGLGYFQEEIDDNKPGRTTRLGTCTQCDGTGNAYHTLED